MCLLLTTDKTDEEVVYMVVVVDGLICKIISEELSPL